MAYADDTSVTYGFMNCVHRSCFQHAKKYHIDLARANSEALGNIYSLFKLNIKSCRAKARRQREL